MTSAAMASSPTSSDAVAFVEKWSRAELSERSASHEHFIDLCRLVGQPTPASADSTGDEYTFEKPVKVTLSASKGSKGESGFVDVWKRGCFAWEYKRKDKYKNLDEAYRQLYQYRDALDNPPLSVVCDIRTTEIRTHFSGYPTEKTVIRLEEIPGKLEVLRRVFTNPDSFKPFKPSVEVTADLAREFSDLADKLIQRYPPGDLTLFQRAGDPVAHFLMKVMFCLFAEDIGALPDKVFTRLVNRCLYDPEQFQPNCAELFEKMKRGGWYGNDRVEFFNGGLFDDAPPLALNHAELNDLARAAQRPWNAVEPSIFGTLFERILDPKKRAQIGAHYTSKEDILLVIEPVIMMPLRRKWTAVQEDFKQALATHDAEPDRKKRDLLAAPIKIALENFRRYLGSQRVLDPACGSGNFLYVALQQLLDLEDEVVRFAARHDIYVDPVPRVRPPQMHGIEINPYAAELAQVVIWIGYLQWLAVHGIADPKRPILDKLQCIENRDAILDLNDRNNPKPAEWPSAEFVVGNPPFLGGSLIWEHLGTDYRDALWSAFTLPNFSDLCCYWFEMAAESIAKRRLVRAGLLATQGIRAGANRSALKRVKEVGDIFCAWADRNWVLEGAAVHVSIVAFDDGTEKSRVLNGAPVPAINVDLSSGIDTASSLELSANVNVCLIGVKKAGRFDMDFLTARKLLSDAGNPNGRPNSDVVRPVVNGIAITRRDPGNWIVDFGESTAMDAASEYHAPFRMVENSVKPEREKNKRAWYRERWWLYAETRPTMRSAQRSSARCVVTPYVTKHRLFSWLDSRTVPADGLFIFARSDDYFLGALHSAVHELWTRRTGSQLREAESGFRYTPSSCFETFPLPWPPGKEDVNHPAYQRIAAAAKELNEKRERWLNPPEWIEPIAARIDAADKFEDVPEAARPLIRQSAIMAAAAKDARLKKRTLTNLYNERPTWLKLAHETLDRAVLAAYAATDPEGDWSEDGAAVWVESGAGQKLDARHPLAAERARVDQAVLANLLRLNHKRAGRPRG
jgi:hypothetical protein